jgi:hypothetical protein
VIFKGGTSLSKGWNLFQRFSEDIDIFLDPPRVAILPTATACNKHSVLFAKVHPSTAKENCLLKRQLPSNQAPISR